MENLYKKSLQSFLLTLKKCKMAKLKKNNRFYLSFAGLKISNKFRRSLEPKIAPSSFDFLHISKIVNPYQGC